MTASLLAPDDFQCQGSVQVLVAYLQYNAHSSAVNLLFNYISFAIGIDRKNSVKNQIHTRCTLQSCIQQCLGGKNFLVAPDNRIGIHVRWI